MTSQTQFVEVDGARLRVAVHGSGPPLLLVMGLGAPIEMWTPLLAHLAGYQTIAFDAPGIGGSAVSPRPLRMGGLAGLTEHLLDTLGYAEVDVLGVSFGGLLMQQLAYQASTRVRRLVLAATGPGLGGVPGNPVALLALSTPLRYYSSAFMRLIAPLVYGGKEGHNHQLRSMVFDLYRRNPPSIAGYYGQLFAATGWTSLPFLHRIQQPTLLLAGDGDPLAPLINARIMAWRMPRAELRVIPGGGHLFVLEQAAEVAALVDSFLRESTVEESKMP